jgi:PAS domain S-box-containing protein
VADVAVDLQLPPRATSAGEARRLLRDALSGVGAPEAVEAAQVAISEIVTNALVHAGTHMRLRVLLTGEALRVELMDGSPHLPHQLDYSDNATTGRGLRVVDEMVDRWGAYPLGDGKVVWFEISETPSEGEQGSSSGPLPADDDPSVVAVVEVELLNMPLLMHAAWQEHAAALLRELLLVNLDDDLTAIESHAAASGALSVLFEQVPPPALLEDPEEIMATAVEPGVSVPQLTLTVPEPAIADFEVLDDMLGQAVVLAERGDLLSPPTQPEVQSMRNWICGQVRAQGAGAPARPWTSPADTLPLTAEPLEWDPAAVSEADRALVAADDANRIVAVSRPALDLLGYDADQLVGQRLISLIPQRYHQAHIAGFTLHLMNGRDPLIGNRVTVPFVRADGSELTLGLVVRSELLPRERRLFTAELFA